MSLYSSQETHKLSVYIYISQLCTSEVISRSMIFNNTWSTNSLFYSSANQLHWNVICCSQWSNYDFCQSLSNISVTHWNNKRKSTLSIVCELLIDLLLFIKLLVLCLTKCNASNIIRTCSYDSDELLSYLFWVQDFYYFL